MVRRSHNTLAWRLFGAALGTLAIVVQLLFSAWLIVDAAAAGTPGSQADLGVICTHEPAARPDAGGAPSAPHEHGQCPACACPQSVKLLAPLPTPPILAVLRPRAAPPHVDAGLAAPQSHSHTPYASRAPPFSA